MFTQNLNYDYFIISFGKLLLGILSIDPNDTVTENKSPKYGTHRYMYVLIW